MTSEQFESAFAALESSQAALSTAATAWQNLGTSVKEIMEGGKGSLKAIDQTLHQTWQSGGAQALYNHSDQVRAWGVGLANVFTDRSSQQVANGTTADSSSMAGILGSLVPVRQTAMTTYKTFSPLWYAFTRKAAQYFHNLDAEVLQFLTNGTSSNGNGSLGATQTENVSVRTTPGLLSTVTVETFTLQMMPTYTESGFQAQSRAHCQVTMTWTVAAGDDSGTAAPQIVVQPVQINLLPSARNLTDGAKTQETTVSKAAGSVQDPDVQKANVDQYLTLLRSALKPVADAYTTASDKLRSPRPAALKIGVKAGKKGGATGGSPGAVPALGGGKIGTQTPKTPVQSASQTPKTPQASQQKGATATPAAAQNAAKNAAEASTGGTSLASVPTASVPGLNSGTGTTTTVPPISTTGTGGSSTGPTIPTVPPVTIPPTDFTTPASVSGLGTGTSGLGTGSAYIPSAAGFGGGGAGLNGESFGTSGSDGLLESPFAGTGTGTGTEDGLITDPQAAAATAAEEQAATQGGSRGGMPYMPMSPMAGAGAGGNGDERRRNAWLDEDEDLWSTGTDPAPAVIGGSS
ncbi:hypothetical protein AB0M11_28630 [Streptomyces sp. NPDC051987]|uniref:hypothetical protein n=1 Tax=Streptomyces sp. NPDC051987 TaxID=3155808 RepID=UPI003426372B